MRIAIDIDGVLTNETTGHDYEARTANNENICAVNTLYYQRHHIILYSARFVKDYKITERWLRVHNVLYDELILGKIQYDILIDDRAVSNFKQLKKWRNR